MRSDMLDRAFLMHRFMGNSSLLTSYNTHELPLNILVRPFLYIHKILEQDNGVQVHDCNDALIRSTHIYIGMYVSAILFVVREIIKLPLYIL